MLTKSGGFLYNHVIDRFQEKKCIHRLGLRLGKRRNISFARILRLRTVWKSKDIKTEIKGKERGYSLESLKMVLL